MTLNWHTRSWRRRVGVFLVVFVSALAFSFYAGMQYQILLETNKTMWGIPAQDAVTAPAKVDDNTVTSSLPLARTYLSEKQTYSFTIFIQPRENRCVFTVNTSAAKAIDISGLIGVSSIPCEETKSGLSSGFQEWLDDNNFVIDVGGKTLQIDVLNMTVHRQ